MNITPSNSEIYYEISVIHYQIYLQLFNDLRNLTVDDVPFDFLTHTPDENEKYKRTWRQQYQSLIVSIVFQAFAVEAFVNFVGESLYDEGYFFGKFEKMKTSCKINKIFSEKLNSDFSKFGDVKESVDKVFHLRDDLAHFKTTRINIEDLKQSPEKLNPIGYVDELYESIEMVKSAYPSFKKIINTLLGYDILDRQKQDNEKKVLETITDVINEALK